MSRVPPVPTPLGGYLCNDAVADPVRAAVEQYKVWDPSRGRYSIGWVSVAGQLDATARLVRNWMHLDSRHWTSELDRQRADAWCRDFRDR